LVAVFKTDARHGPSSSFPWFTPYLDDKDAIFFCYRHPDLHNGPVSTLDHCLRGRRKCATYSMNHRKGGMTQT
jgi:hypothetical protein